MKLFFSAILFFSLQSFALLSPWHSTLPETSKFKVSDELEDRVDFWVKIYSKYTTTQGLFHLVDDPGKVLGEIDLTEIYNDPKTSPAEKRRQMEQEILLKKIFVVEKYKIKNPKRVRLQMGLSDRMRKALFLSGKYIDQMEAIFRKEGLPIELTRLVFVESSFNIYAQSKVGASGLWQIMPNVARPQGYIGKAYDKRNHPYYATKLAAKILKENYRNLKSWPLAITAYNHGLTGVKRMVTRNDSNRIEELIESENVTRTWGFASKNFYACFLAVLQVEQNAVDLFGEGLIKAESLAYKEFRLKNAKKKKDVLRWFDGSVTRLKQMNPHINWSYIKKKKVFPAGLTIMIPEKNIGMVRNQFSMQ